MAAAALPREFGYVAVVVVLYSLLNFWMAAQVIRARKRYKVSYPALYALESENKDAMLFNCIQRGHQNSLELMPLFFVTLLLGGIQHPVLAAALGALYTVSRFFYFRGYSTGIPENRNKLGGFYFLALVGLILCTASLGIRLLIRGVL
ncbi:unnamed protein product [Spirodela intermedia]|uniref:Glutathione S-transferase 3, mitochondrial n=2 Tax=Spirodela intermedia TaxID=51605 RepID=A0A7I8J255_SPIIN|nr:unnamed protein product [Spirodela intermedia]CAA6664305.1 unnamed protein product [Spirodela intermedia]CAA7400873.1 unnamed protein product [Spirodela intermedia]